MSDEDKGPSGKVYDLLKGYFWSEGGWLVCVGDGGDKVYVYTSRKLKPYEREIIPREMDGMPVIVKVTGIPRIS